MCVAGETMDRRVQDRNLVPVGRTQGTRSYMQDIGTQQQASSMYAVSKLKLTQIFDKFLYLVLTERYSMGFSIG